MKKEYVTPQIEKLEFDYVKATVSSACSIQQMSVVYAGQTGCTEKKETTYGDQ